ncbi:MAG: TonB-dependent receptor [Parvularculaceae bacterium]
MKKMKMLMLCGAALPLVAQGAAAQDGAGSEPAASSDTITVTARRRTENLQDVPDSVTVLGSEVIEDAGVRGINDVAAMTSNLNYMNYEQPGVVAVSIRGISQLRIGQASVAFVVDGVTVYNPQEFSQELFDIQQIEVLKGPQGALYGINSIGGAINITTKQPSNEIEGMVRLGYAKGNEKKAFARVSGPLVEDKVLFSVSGNYRKTDGLLNDIYGRDVDAAEETGLRGRLVFNLADNLTADFRGTYTRLDAGALYFAPEQNLFGGEVLGEINADVLQHTERNVGSASGKISYEAGFATVDFISAWTKLTSSVHQDGDTTGLSAFEFIGDNEAKTIVEEIRFTSPSDQRFRWIFGGLYMNFNRYETTDIMLNLNGPFNGGAGVPSEKDLVVASQNLDDLENNIYAVFGQINYDVLDNLELTLALRYDADHAKITRIGGATQTDTYSAWQPKASLAYHFTDDLMGYATFSKGFRSGGFNSVNVFGADYKQEGTTNYEAGVKSTLFGGKATLSLAGFYTDYKDQQIFIYDLATSSQNLVNAPDSRIYGVEVDFAARPFEGLDFNASFGYLDTKLKSFPDLPSASVDTSIIPGKRIPLSTEYTANVSAQYEHPIAGDWSGFGRVDYERRGDMYWQADNLDVQKAFNLVNLRAGIENDNFTASVYVKNAFDKAYLENFFPGEWLGFIDLSYPSNNRRQYGFEASYKF